MGSVAIMCIAGMFFYSCKKDTNSVYVPAVNDNMYTIAEIVQGKVFAGRVNSAANDSVLTIDYNNSSQFVFVQEMPGALKVDVPSLPSAEIITSVYGIIIKDGATGKTVLLANNDAESIRRFEEVKAVLKSNYTSSTVFGITIVQAEKNTPGGSPEI